MIAGTLALLLGLMLAFPGTPTGRWLHAELVERPVLWLDRQTALGLAKGAVLFIAGLILFLGMPEMMVVLMAVGEPALAIEAGLALYAAAAVGAFRGLRERAIRIALRPLTVVRLVMSLAARAPRRPRRRPGAGKRGEDPEPAFGFAFAPACA